MHPHDRNVVNKQLLHATNLIRNVSEIIDMNGKTPELDNLNRIAGEIDEINVGIQNDYERRGDNK